MKKTSLLDFRIFGHDRPILKFLIMLAILTGADLVTRVILYFIGDAITWKTVFIDIALSVTLATISYFVGRFLAYKTTLFQKMNRDNVLKLTFFGLFIIGILLTILIGSYIVYN